MPSVSAHVAHTLSAHIDHVFGVMGNGNALFLDALDRTPDAVHGACATRPAASSPPTRTTAPRAASPPRPRPTAPGFTNTLTALAEAAQARIPLVLVVGDEPTTGSRPWDVDQIAMAAAASARARSRSAERMSRPRPCSRSSTRWPTAPPSCSRSPTTSPASRSARPTSGRMTRLAPSTRGRIATSVADPRTPCPRAPADARRRRRARTECSPTRSRRSRSRAPVPARRSRRLARRRRRGARSRSPTPPAPSPPRRRSGAACSPTTAFDLGVTGGFGAGGGDAARARGRRRRRVRRVAQPVHDALRRAVRAGHPGGAGRRRRDGDAPERVVGSSVPTPASSARALVDRARRDRRRAVGLARVGRRRGRCARTSPATPPPRRPTRPAQRRRPHRASCCPRIASSSPTAGTSSAGRTCTGRSHRPTA